MFTKMVECLICGHRWETDVPLGGEPRVEACPECGYRGQPTTVDGERGGWRGSGGV